MYSPVLKLAADGDLGVGMINPCSTTWLITALHYTTPLQGIPSTIAAAICKSWCIDAREVDADAVSHTVYTFTCVMLFL